MHHFPLLVIPILEVLFLLLFFGMIGATIFYAIKEKKPRVPSAKKKSKSPSLGEPELGTNEQMGGFGNDDAGTFDFNPEEFKK